MIIIMNQHNNNISFFFDKIDNNIREKYIKKKKIYNFSMNI